MPAWKKLLVVVVLLIAITAGGVYVVPAVVDLVGRGVRLSETNVLEGGDDPDDKTIEDDPDKLTYDAGEILGRAVTKDAYSAARMVRSEEPDANDFTKECLVHVALNDAARKGVSLFRILTLSSNPARTGFYGKQTSRRYSTRSDPYERDLILAEKAIAEHASADPTAGAWKFYHKQIGDIVGVAGYDDVVESWAREGARPFTLGGTPARLVFFNSTGIA